MSAVNVTVNFDGDSIPLPGGENAKRFVHAAAIGNVTLSGTQTIDDVVLPSGKRVLLTDQDDATENGIWVVRAGTWKRAADFRAAANVVPGSTIYVEAGTVNGRRTFQLTTPTPIVVGTTELEFEEFGNVDFTELLNNIILPPANFQFSTDRFRWQLETAHYLNRFELEASYDNGDSWVQVFLDNYTRDGSGWMEYVWTPPAGIFRIRSSFGNYSGEWTSNISAP